MAAQGRSLKAGDGQMSQVGKREGFLQALTSASSSTSSPRKYTQTLTTPKDQGSLRGPGLPDPGHTRLQQEPSLSVYSTLSGRSQEKPLLSRKKN